jgi:FAD/FMN-containing dehydrogenase
MTTPDSIIETLRAAVGAANVLMPGQDDLSAYTGEKRQRGRGLARAVVRPASSAEVVQVVRACAAAQVPIVPQGGNTGLAYGSVPDLSGTWIVLSTQRMNRLRAIDTANATITVESGCILADVQRMAAEAGMLFPLSLAAQGSCTIGGNLATNAGGTQVLRYGNTRDLCLGLEVVTAQGEIWQGLSGLRKDNTGYSLRDLFIGSEGTLGIITAACMKLYPQPRARMTAWAAVPDLQAAVQLLNRAREALASGLTGFEAMNRLSLDKVARHFPQQRLPFPDAPWCVLLELSDSESEAHARAAFEPLLAQAIEAGCVSDAVVAENLTQAQELWQARELLPVAQGQDGPGGVQHDISLPISRIASFIAETNDALLREFPGTSLVTYGHLGDGNLHYTVKAPPGVDGLAYIQENGKQINLVVYDAVHKAGGSISAEHGIGSLKAPILPRYKSPVALDLMRRIKTALDPQGLLNPGRILA